MKIISDSDQINLSALDEFVSQHPYGNFFQSAKAFQFFQAADNYTPILIAAMDGEEIVGSLLSFVFREGGGLQGYFSRRCIIWGGPLVKDEKPDIYEQIVLRFNKIADKAAIYSQFRNLFDLSSGKNIFLGHKWSFYEHLNIIVDLSKSEATLWKEVHSKRRNEIRRAQKEGTSFRVLESRDEFDTTYDILKEVYGRARLPLPGIEFFRMAYDILGPEHFRIFLAINEEKIIGTMYVLCFKDTMYDWYAGSYQTYYKKYPNDLIPWKAFLWGKENGFKIFDFGGAGKPDVPYGVRDYKKKFGGKFVQYGRFEKVHKPLLFQFGKLGLKVWQKLH